MFYIGSVFRIQVNFENKRKYTVLKTLLLFLFLMPTDWLNSQVGLISCHIYSLAAFHISIDLNRLSSFFCVLFSS